ncbi:MAG: Hsp70 family protein, partial [Planctomycetota bacterium]
DVIPLSLGIETMGGAVAKLIVANSTIPARATEMFSTYAEGQTNVKIHVLQGERELVKDCRSLATFDLTGIPPMPAGLPKINVTFLVDANGILSVQAVEERSGRRAQIQVVPNHGLTRDEIAQIESDSFTHARADMNAHRLIDLRLNAKLDLRNIQKQLDRFADDTDSPNQKSSIKNQKSLSLDPAYRAQIEAHMQTVQTYIDTPDADNDADAFQQALHDLDHATLRLAELNIARTLRDEN